MTRQEAESTLQHLANDIVFNYRCSKREALTAVARNNPSLVAALNGKSTAQFSNDLPRGTPAERAKRTELIRDGVREIQERMFREKGVRPADSYDAARVEFANAHPELKPFMFSNIASASGMSSGALAAYKYPAYTPGQLVDGPSKAATADAVKLHNRGQALNLPADATEAEVEAAEAANSSDPDKVFASLVKYAMREHGYSKNVAGVYCMGRFQKLAALCRDKSFSDFTVDKTTGKNI